jgi:hypothetical protein
MLQYLHNPSSTVRLCVRQGFRRVIADRSSAYRGNATSVVKAIGAVAMHRVVKDVVFPIFSLPLLQQQVQGMPGALDVTHGIAVAATAAVVHAVLYPFEYVRYVCSIPFPIKPCVLAVSRVVLRENRCSHFITASSLIIYVQARHI